MAKDNEKKTKPNTRVVYSADITKEYLARKNDPAYADCLEELEREYKFHMLNHEISLLKGDDSYSKEKILDLRIESGLYSDSDVKKFKAQKKLLEKKTPGLKLVKQFAIAKIIFLVFWFALLFVIIGNAINVFSGSKTSFSSLVSNITSSSDNSFLSKDKLEFFNGLSGKHKVDYILNNMPAEDKVAYAYDKLSNDTNFANLSQEEKDSHIQNFYKTLNNDQQLDLIDYFTNKYFK